MLFGHLFDRGEGALAGAREQDVDLALLPLDCLVKPVQVGELGGVCLNAGHVAADLAYSFLQALLVAAGDEDVGTFFDIPLRRSQSHAGGGRRNHCYFAA